MPGYGKFNVLIFIYVRQLIAVYQVLNVFSGSSFLSLYLSACPLHKSGYLYLNIPACKINQPDGIFNYNINF